MSRRIRVLPFLGNCMLLAILFPIVATLLLLAMLPIYWAKAFPKHEEACRKIVSFLMNINGKLTDLEFR